MEKPKRKPETKKANVKQTQAKKAKKISLLDAAIIGATTPTMGGLEH